MRRCLHRFVSLGWALPSIDQAVVSNSNELYTYKYKCLRFLPSDALKKQPSPSGHRKVAHRGGIPYLSADNFGRPTLLHPSSKPAADLDDAGPGPASEETEGARRGRKGRTPPRTTNNDTTFTQHEASPPGPLITSRFSPGWRGGEHARSAARQQETVEAAPTSRRAPASINRDQPSTTTTSLPRSQPQGPPRRPPRGARPPSASTADASAAAAEGNDGGRQDRTLTYRLLKSTTLRELDQLLAAHDDSRLNIIHLAAAAHQAVLLGSLQQPRDTLRLLDRHLERWAAANPQHHPHQVHHQAAAMGSGQGVQLQRQHDAQLQRPAEAAAGPRSEAGPAGPERPGDLPAGPALPDSSPSSSPYPTALPLSELGDVLRAYGKLRARPPDDVWRSALRPMLLNPEALGQLQRGDGAEGGLANTGPHATAGPERHARKAAATSWRGGGDSGAQGDRSKAGGKGGQTLSKLATALARMREDDPAVWRVVARAAAVTAPDMSPRALSSVLWAFGSVRLAHGPFLVAATRAVRADLTLHNGQDMACVMWALARLAPEPGQPLTAATAAVQDLLYGDLADAVRRRLPQQTFKPAELTTLLGALDEMARLQAASHPPAGSGAAEGVATGGLSLERGRAARPRTAVPQVSPRLLRVVSQAVRKNLSALPASVLAEASVTFQRLGHHDAALYRALAGGMVARLRHLEPRHLMRAATALQAAGFSERVFYWEVLEASRLKLAGFTLEELMAMVEVGTRLAAQYTREDDRVSTVAEARAEAFDDDLYPDPESGSRTQAGPGGGGGGRGSPGAIDMDLNSEPARAFMRAAIRLAVSVSAAHQLDSRRRWGGGDKFRSRGPAESPDAADLSSDPPAGGIREPLRLRHWNALLRAAAVTGFGGRGGGEEEEEEKDLADEALDAVVAELGSLRPRWLAAIRTRAASQPPHLPPHLPPPSPPPSPDERGHQRHPHPQQHHHRNGNGGAGDNGDDGDDGHHHERGDGTYTALDQAVDGTTGSVPAVAPGHDPMRTEVARVVSTAALLGRHERVDLVATVVALLREASATAAEAAEEEAARAAAGVGTGAARGSYRPAGRSDGRAGEGLRVVDVGGPAEGARGPSTLSEGVDGLPGPARRELVDALRAFEPFLGRLAGPSLRAACWLLRQRLGDDVARDGERDV